MPTLRVKNFLSIKNANMEINPLVVVIGPQASGKSILAKLTYYFTEFTNEGLWRSLREGVNLKSFEKKQKDVFVSMFPKYAWINSEFEIEYSYDDILIKIQNKKSRKRIVFSFDFSDRLENLYTTIHDEWRDELEKLKKETSDTKEAPFIKKAESFKNLINQHNTESAFNLSNAVFIPAGRSFFSIIKENVFSFLSENVEIDYFLKEFGKAFELAKNVYPSESRGSSNKTIKRIEQYFREIVCGQYKHLKDGDWIENETSKVRLINSSSGQQESLPMLLVLFSFSNIKFYFTNKNLFFIEEPEAHLYPLAQKKIIELIGFLFNNEKNKNSFFITTHSPYVLTCLNNLILSNKIRTENNEFETSIPFDMVSAYALENGVLRTIKDDEIIDATFIDNISNIIEKEYDNILGKIYEGAH